MEKEKNKQYWFMPFSIGLALALGYGLTHRLVIPTVAANSQIKLKKRASFPGISLSSYISSKNSTEDDSKATKSATRIHTHNLMEKNSSNFSIGSYDEKQLKTALDKLVTVSTSDEVNQNKPLNQIYFESTVNPKIKKIQYGSNLRKHKFRDVFKELPKYQ